MLVQTINPYQSPFLQLLKTNTNQIIKNSKNYYYENGNSVSFPSCYYLSNFNSQISFGRSRKRSEIIEDVGRENFPSPVILERFETQNDKSLYDIHKDYYKGLLDCKTLDEAKKMYPEFKKVVDAKDIDLTSLGNTNILRKINAGKIEGLSLDNLSLELLKRHYAEVKYINKKENYFGITNDPVLKLLNSLNIKMNSVYYRNLYTQNDELKKQKLEQMRSENALKNRAETLRSDKYRKMRSKLSKEMWTPDLREKQSKTLKNAYASNQGLTKFFSEKMKERWANDDGTMLAQVLSIWNGAGSEERRAAKSIRMKEYYATEAGERFIAAQKLAWERHPEIKEMMSEIAKKFLSLSRILAKLDRKEKLSQDEQRIYLTYLRECEEKMPDYHKIIGEETKKILEEWKSEE